MNPSFSFEPNPHKEGMIPLLQTLLRSFIEDTLNAQGPRAYHVHITYDNAAFES